MAARRRRVPPTYGDRTSASRSSGQQHKLQHGMGFKFNQLPAQYRRKCGTYVFLGRRMKTTASSSPDGAAPNSL